MRFPYGTSIGVLDRHIKHKNVISEAGFYEKFGFNDFLFKFLFEIILILQFFANKTLGKTSLDKILAVELYCAREEVPSE